MDDKNVTISENPWDTVNRSTAYLTVACVPELSNEAEVNAEETQKIVYFNKLDNGGRQIKRLDFLVGDLRIDMQILFERKCHMPSTSAGALTLSETKVNETQTKDNLNDDTKRITLDDMMHANVDNSELNNSPDNVAIQRDEQCQEAILLLQRDNDELTRRYNDQNQAIERLFHAIKRKNQQLTASNDDEMNNTQNADSRRHFTDNLSRFECQQCVQCSNLLAQSQHDNDTLKLQLKRIAVSHETQIRTIQRKLKQSIERNAHFVESLDIIRNLQSKLESENDKLKQEADEWRKHVAALNNQNEKHASQVNVGQTKTKSMSLDSKRAVEMPLSSNAFMTKSTIQSDALSLEKQIKSLDDEPTQNDCESGTKQSTSQLGSSEMSRRENHVEQMRRMFEAQSGKVKRDVSLAKRCFESIRNANSVLSENQASFFHQTTSKSVALSQIAHKQTDRIAHLIESELTENVWECNGEKLSKLSRHLLSKPNKQVLEEEHPPEGDAIEWQCDGQGGILKKGNIPIAKKINQNVDSILGNNQTSIDENCIGKTTPVNNDLIVKSKPKALPKIERKQIDRTQCDGKTHYQNRRATSVSRSMPISDTEAMHGNENMTLNKSKTNSSSKPKSPNQKLRDSGARCVQLEKGKCHHTKQTNPHTVRSSGRDKLSGCECCRKAIGSQNTAITCAKTNSLSKYSAQMPVNTSVDVNVDKSVVTDDNKRKSLRSDQRKEKSTKSAKQTANINLNAKYNRKSTKSRGGWQSANSPQPKSTLQRYKLDPKTWIPDILVRIIHDDNEQIHRKSLTNVTAISSTIRNTSASTSSSASLYTNLCILSNEARADKLTHLCQQFAEHNTIDVLTSEEMQFLDEYSTEAEKFEKIAPLLTQVDLKRLRQINKLLTQVHVSKESLS